MRRRKIGKHRRSGKGEILQNRSHPDKKSINTNADDSL